MVDYASRAATRARQRERTDVATFVRRLDWILIGSVGALIGYGLSQLSRIEAARGDRERCEEHVRRARRDVEPQGVGCLAVYNACSTSAMLTR